MDRLQALRQEKGLNMKEAAQALEMPYTTYVNYEKGAREPSAEVLIKLAEFYNTTIDYLLGKTERADPPAPAEPPVPIPPGFEPLPKMKRVPHLGTIACGGPILAEQNLEGYDIVPEGWNVDFTLTCRGDSMEPKILDGDVVAIHCQPTVENGEIAAVRLGDEATLKRVFLFSDHIELRAENPAYPSIIRIGEAMNEVHIEGKAIGLCCRRL